MHAIQQHNTPFVTVANTRPQTSIDSQNNLEDTWYKYRIYVTAMFDADWWARENSGHFVYKFKRARKKEATERNFVYVEVGLCKTFPIIRLQLSSSSPIWRRQYAKSACRQQKVVTTNIRVNGMVIQMGIRETLLDRICFLGLGIDEFGLFVINSATKLN